MMSGVSVVDSVAVAPPLQPEVALTAGEEDLDEIVALCDDLKIGHAEEKQR